MTPELTSDDLARFRSVQKLAYRCVQAVEADLREGMTERQAAQLMRIWLADHGVHEMFHAPFVWFGARTSFSGFRSPRQFFPTALRLEPGMPIILDVAPLRDGYSADVGYSCCLGENPALRKLQDDLEPYRALIPKLVKQKQTTRAIYEAVDRLASQQGYRNRHRVYPQRVLAHRMFRIEPSPLSRLAVGGFALGALRGLTSAAQRARLGHHHDWPFWNDGRRSDILAQPGLWAVEPHLALGPIGAKWEEMLVVTEDDAYWLDDDLPHVRRWHRSDRAVAPLPRIAV